MFSIKFKSEVFINSLSWFTVILIPACHIFVLWYYWSEFSYNVNKNECICSCWDTVFKGPYESQIAGFKNFYFNATPCTLKIWIIVVTGIIFLYETLKRLSNLLFVRKRLRCSMAVLCLSSFFPHYYSWWVYINYYNDEFYDQWNHQLFFTVTEFVSTIIVLYLCDKANQVTERKALAIIGISLVHIYASGIDQFVDNVLYGEGEAHQIVRDYGFMGPDLLHTLIPIYLIIENKKYSLKQYNQRTQTTQSNIIFMCIFVFLGCLTLSVL